MPETPEPTFEQSLKDLELVVRSLEEGSIGLDESLAAYERGVALLRTCYQKLKSAEQRIVQLTGTDEDGNPVLQPVVLSTAIEPDAMEPKRRRRNPTE